MPIHPAPGPAILFLIQALNKSESTWYVPVEIKQHSLEADEKPGKKLRIIPFEETPHNLSKS